MSADTPTPRTDAHIHEMGPVIAGIYVGSTVHPDFARQLERELAAKDATIARLTAERDAALGLGTGSPIEVSAQYLASYLCGCTWIDGRPHRTPQTAMADVAEWRAIFKTDYPMSIVERRESRYLLPPAAALRAAVPGTL